MHLISRPKIIALFITSAFNYFSKTWAHTAHFSTSRTLPPDQETVTTQLVTTLTDASALATAATQITQQNVSKVVLRWWY
ncbi:MAG: hypothetical protein B0W54_23055 [Cellvibrio sp. 79]|nr:MAG: hypothetical protein B0W54_23055 [Cellvibrio sp. 79]